MAVALAQHADQTFNEVDIVLQSVLEHLQNDGASAAGRIRTHEFMVTTVGAMPQLAGLFVYDAKGRWLVNSQPLLQTRFNNAEHDYFRYHLTHRTDKAYIGKPMRSQTSGQWVLTVSRRVNNPDGSFAGVALATIDLSYFDRFYQQFDIGREGAILFGLSDGTLIHRRPLLSDSVGKNISRMPLFRDYVSRGPGGTFEMRSPQDGVVRISSYQHPAAYPLFVVVSLGKNDVLEDWSRHLWVRSLGVALLLLVICYGGNKLVAQVSRREAAERQAIESKLELEELYQALEAQAQKDGLTEVFNRRYFDQTLSSELARFSRSGGSLSLVMLDVDHFKKFNDTYGHAAGDVCLQQVAAAIANVAQRHCDVVARYGGEEFALILPTCGKTCAHAVADQMVEAVRALRIAHAASPGGAVTISVGVATLAHAGGFQAAPRDLIEVADEALYSAKEQGRDRAVHRDFTVLKTLGKTYMAA
nr:sensor domain-containing diguanylate cyclase [Herbaspirillum sp. LeCh32-8]